MKLSAGILLMMFCSSMMAQNGVTVVDSLNARHGGPGPSWGFYYASLWGYVAPDGHEYALIGCYSGTSIIDLETTPIQEVAYIPGANNEWKEIKTWGQYAYAVSEGSSQGLQIIDLSQLPDTAWLVRSISSIGGKNISRNHTITVADGHLYLNGSTGGGQVGGVIILSLADPENPSYVGEYSPVYFHDTYVRNDTLYGAAINANGGLYITSVSNKAVPQQLAYVTYPGSGTHNTWASVDGRYVFTTDEIGTTAKNMKVWDIQNLPTVVQQTPYTPSPTTVIHNVHGRGNYIYISHYKAGVFVADIHDPLSIVTAGSYNTYRGGGTHPAYAGCWGVYPYFPSGRWIASDTQTGLYVLRFDGLVPRTRSPLIAPAHADTLRPPTLAFRWQRAASQAEDPHYYQLRVWGPGVDTLIRSADTSLALSGIAGLQDNQTYQWHVWIRDEFTAVTSQDTFLFVYDDTQVGVETSSLVPLSFSLRQNFPNPFNPSTSISFVLTAPHHTTLKVYNLLGEEVATLIDGVKGMGEHTLLWSPVDVPSGVYLYRLSSGGKTLTRKMILMK